MKKILGLDLGSASIGWAFVHEDDIDKKSEIINTGVRIVPLTTEEESDFKKGNTISINADRTLKRGARRNLQRFKLRREALLEIFKEAGFIPQDYHYAEDGENTTFSTYELRAKAATEMISKEELVKVLLMINKKRGYKSSRKAKSEEEGQAIDGMAIAKELYTKNITPGQWVYTSLSEGGKYIPDFYRSDLISEFEKIVRFQNQFYPEIFNDKLLEVIKVEKSKVSDYFKTLHIELAENKGNYQEKRLQQYEWRANAVKQELTPQETAYILTEIKKQINNSSGYLGAISDRSKELYFDSLTVGQYLYQQLKENSHNSLKNQVFYRQDYMDEFDKIWKIQSKHHKELTEALRKEVRDITIFYQRRLKSQKHLISHCEFEKQHRVIPKSSPLFQEFRIWQNINAIVIKNTETKETLLLDEDAKDSLSEALNFKDNLTDLQLLKFFNLDKRVHEVNFKKIEGNRTNTALYKAFEAILRQEGQDALDFSKMDAEDIKSTTALLFKDLNIDTHIIDFNAELQGNDFDKQPYYQLWHLLYSAEDDAKLKDTLQEKFGFKPEHTHHIANVDLQADYGNLSAKAIKKILPELKDGHMYDKACDMAGYNHSSSLTKEENENRPLKEKLELLKKNSLRNPVVEKILNQMINLVNAIIADPTMGTPNDIRVELARELKANSEQRGEMTRAINKATKEHEEIRKLLKSEFGIPRVTRNDIIRYKLWKETNGISIYTGKCIEASKLFTKEYDIEHIIPKSRLFDDSFSNKTLCERQFNIDKANRTAFSICQEKHSEFEFEQYQKRVNELFTSGKIKYTKYKKLLMADNEIPEGFIERQLRESQYIAKKAKELLQEVSRNVTPTIGSITDRLREDWELIEVMKELNWDKYHKLGLTREETGKGGERLRKINDWTKRNDHRHHAMDALTVAFTKPQYINYLNNLNARDRDGKKINSILGIEEKYLEYKKGKLKFKSPIPNFREEAKKHLENIIVSYKAKNKVVTKNKNITKTAKGTNSKIQLTPRGQLHKETVYGKIVQYNKKQVKVNAGFTADVIKQVVNAAYKDALLTRLEANDGDPKKAFTGKNSLTKNPVYLNNNTQVVPDKVEISSPIEVYTIRKEVTPDNFKDERSINKVIDAKVRELLLNRLREYGDAKKAFSNLTENPICLNREENITVKRVTISGVSNVEALHTKKDHNGNEILDNKGKPIPTDFVSTGNNHHVAIYRDDRGNLQEEVVSFYEAVIRKNLGLPIIDKNHKNGWEFLFTMKQNEFFVFPNTETGFDPETIDLLDPKNRELISPNLFRVQKIATKNYYFRHHLETTVEDKKELKNITYKPIQSLKPIEPIIKVRVNHLGHIVQVGEY
ncbi:type II CRISPR RNA-guided endonuclease Cas9 [Flavobacterium litorale]|uniref:CRISPR-associated endonuclease Cas9 n=1 Tax=Flavobacterium litorale TaxID=2856519 RepID=A0ABX8V5Z3_9FLAO|nr:type II CRISPR RNA-guided endonuclease Cas9 [Flavobacterium litorale]QYJ68251.1 type II CRISPR RNA-guided endonuclease Cas9 [Flavobacterium litorale]